MLHTPRLCIDGRAAADFPGRGELAQELVDQLVSSVGEANGPGEWVERQRTVLVSHPQQTFSGQIRRFDTGRRIGWSPLYWWWEQHFSKGAQISAFHRFRPADRLRPALELQTINTLLPPVFRMPQRFPSGPNHQYVVPSEKDAALVRSRLNGSDHRITVIRPGVRRYVHFASGPAPAGEKGKVLILRGRRFEPRLRKLLYERFPHHTLEILPLDGAAAITPAQWVNLVGQASLCFYLDSSPFDWGTLALEAIYWRLPCVFDDAHGALSELPGMEKLKLSKYLIDPPSWESWRQRVEEVRAALAAAGTFDPFALAAQYAKVYDTLLPVVG